MADHALRKSATDPLRKSASSTKVHLHRPVQHPSRKSQTNLRHTPKVDAESDDGYFMAGQPQFCSFCDRQIMTPELRLYCSKDCARQDSTGHLSPQSPDALPPTFSFESLSLSLKEPPRDIIPLRSPTSPNSPTMQLNRWSISSFQPQSEAADSMPPARPNPQHRQMGSDYLTSSYPAEIKGTTMRPPVHRSTKSTMSTPSLSHTPSSYLAASSVPKTPLERRMTPNDVPTPNWANTRPSLPSRTNPFSASFNRTGNISLVMPTSTSIRTPEIPPSQQASSQGTIKPATPIFGEQLAEDVDLDSYEEMELEAPASALVSSASPNAGLLRRHLFNFEGMQRPPTVDARLEDRMGGS